jgi:hypothetical protein
MDDLREEAAILVERRQYHALCVQDEDGTEEIAFLDLGKDEDLGQLVGMAVYTTGADGEAQREDLNKYRGTVAIASVNAEDLLDAMNRGVPTSVFIDGEKVAGSVFKARIKDELGIPLKRPRLIRRPPDPPV